MTQFLFNKLKDLCEHPKIFVEAVTHWDFKPEKEPEALNMLLKRAHLRNLLVNPKLVNHRNWGPALIFKTPLDPHLYAIYGILENDEVYLVLAKKNTELPS